MSGTGGGAFTDGLSGDGSKDFGGQASGDARPAGEERPLGNGRSGGEDRPSGVDRSGGEDRLSGVGRSAGEGRAARESRAAVAAHLNGRALGGATEEAPDAGRAAAGDRPAGGAPTAASQHPDDATEHGVRRPKRTLAALALGLCAAGLAIGSGADFTARTANPSNVFSAGSLSMENSKDGTAIFSPTGMTPGGAPKTGVVDIKNTGSIDGRFTVSRDQLTNTDVNNDNPIQFAAKVAVAIVDCGQFTTVNTAYGPDPVTPVCGDADDHTVYLGPLSVQNGDFELGTYAPGEKHRYEFEGSLDQSAGNEFAGDSSTARYVFDAKQTP